MRAAFAALVLCMATSATEPPKHYVCVRSTTAIHVDGRLDDGAWREARWTDWFTDIEGNRKPRPRFRTRVKMLWDDEYFYVGAELEEPDVWATLTQHDSVIFHDNDFEVFLDPDGKNHEYFEFEINALNTGWDLFLPKPYKDGGKADNGWEIPGLKSAVRIRGTLNDPRDRDRGWWVELAFPWSAFRRGPPKDGEQWRVNFSRVEWRHRPAARLKVEKEDNWVWSPQGVIDMHRPERWGYVQFSRRREAFKPDPTATVRDALHRVYYAQREFHQRNGRWATSLTELGLRESVTLAPTPDGFVATSGRMHIRQDSLVWLE